MSGRIEPGCMAVIRRPWMIGSDIGRPVQVLRFAVHGEWGRTRDGQPTVAMGSPERAFLCDAAGPGFPCFIAESCLRRIDDGGLASKPELQPERIGTPEGIAHA